MSNRRTLIAVAAVVLAVAAGIGAWAYVSGADQRAQDRAKLVEAYVARQNISKGTSGDQVVNSGMLAKRRVPREAGLLRGTTIGLALVLLPGNAWVHWFAFALAPLVLRYDDDHAPLVVANLADPAKLPEILLQKRLIVIAEAGPGIAVLRPQ